MQPKTDTDFHLSIIFYVNTTQIQSNYRFSDKGTLHIVISQLFLLAANPVFQCYANASFNICYNIRNDNNQSISRYYYQFLS